MLDSDTLVLWAPIDDFPTELASDLVPCDEANASDCLAFTLLSYCCCCSCYYYEATIAGAAYWSGFKAAPDMVPNLYLFSACRPVGLSAFRKAGSLYLTASTMPEVCGLFAILGDFSSSSIFG